ncbi:hypothetical protein PsorP6_006402 [Peronosclerospora sorghi]|uniref:Uncharacterized protein n=1 Tax=Peronosclerospora sorghi TaxID=230839 RepID=A0ACC0W8C8_9STRA|nr:hypothetical protein PsorP6_006402 [Peronosclerospora sorghi]
MQQPPLTPADGIPYLGSLISLVSKTDIRYEGFLFNIDTRQSTVALQNVRSFGTEGRRADHVPPSPHVLQYATFKASEIKDLHVCEAAPTPEVPKLPVQPPLPPGPPPVVPEVPKPTLLNPTSVSSPQTQIAETQMTETQIQGPNQFQPEEPRRHEGNTIPGMGGHLLKRKERRVPGGKEGAGIGPDVASGEFNFAEGLNDFNKQQEFSKLQDEAKKKESTGSYHKSSFFDTISCDALDRLEGQRTRMSGAEERKLNTETFGAVGLNNRRNFRGRGRGRRGGNRSVNRNGGRGGRGVRDNGDKKALPSGP